MAEGGDKTVKYVPMILEKSQVPKGAIRLTENDILNIQKARLNRCPASERFAFRFGPHILGGSTMMTGMAINSYFRTRFYLQSFGVLYSYVPIVVIPTAVCFAVNEYMSSQVLLQSNCKGCLQVRSGILQVATSVMYSGMLAPILCIVLSRKYLTFRNPKRKFEPSFKYAFKMSSSTLGWFASLVAANFILGALVRYKQQVQLDHIIEQEPISTTREILESIRD